MPCGPARSDRVAGLTYVVIMPARNEDAYIEESIKSVVSQAVRPLRGVIVSDGSTDRTDEIVKRCAALHDWSELERMPERKERHFAGKVHAFDAGATRVQHLPYDLIANLDADVSFEPDYVEYLLRKFGQSPELGVVGTNQLQNAWEKRPRYDFGSPVPKRSQDRSRSSGARVSRRSGDTGPASMAA